MADKINIDWEPAPGVILCRPIKREEMQDTGGLKLPDSVGKQSDNVGVGEVIKCGPKGPNEIRLLADVAKISAAGIKIEHADLTTCEPGDLVAWMPYTDQLIEIDMVKYSLVGYANVRAVRKKK